MTDRDRDGRPDPDALLALSKGDRRGRLKVFLGAAPGVGKTYAMLQNARRLKSEGVDVLIGLVETHGRKDTEALLDGLDVLPRGWSIIRAARSASSISTPRWRASRS
jgi:two-component system sensor histidine kinase KdpD